MQIKNNQNGFQSALAMWSLVAVVLVLFMGYLIYKAPAKLTPVATTTAATTPAVATTSGSSTTSSTGSDTASNLQNQLNNVNAATSSNTADLSSANSGLNDQSTFTGY